MDPKNSIIMRLYCSKNIKKKSNVNDDSLYCLILHSVNWMLCINAKIMNKSFMFKNHRDIKSDFYASK